MTLINFMPNHPLQPIFAVKLCPTMHKLITSLPNLEGEKLARESLGIKEKRIVQLVPVKDNLGREGTILVVYDYFFEKKVPTLDIPQNDDGSFNFKIYDIDFNQEIELENLLQHLRTS